MSATGDLTHDPSTNAPREAPKPPPMPAAPDVATIEAAIRGEHAVMLAEAEAWIASAARAPAEITDEKTAAGFAKTISELGKAARGAEKIHAALKKPWFDVTKAIDAVFLAGVAKRADQAKTTLEAVQKRYLAKLREEESKRLAAEARAREEEAAKLREAEAAKMREAERAMDQGDMDTAQDKMAEAVATSEQADAAQQDAAKAEARSEGGVAGLVRTHHASGVLTSARGFWNVDLLDISTLSDVHMLSFWKALAPFIGPDLRLKAAKAAVKAGLRDCPGLKIYEDFTPINR